MINSVAEKIVIDLSDNNLSNFDIFDYISDMDLNNKVNFIYLVMPIQIRN